MRLVDTDAIKLPKGFFESVDNVPKFYEWLNTLPTIDPVKHGKWLRTEAFPHHVYCSVCSKTYIPNDRWQIWTDGDLPRDYCPNCGARMDGGKYDQEG